MKNLKVYSLNVFTVLFLIVFVLVPGVNPDLTGQTGNRGSDGKSYTMAAPTSITSAASAVGPAGATLNGSVSANSEDTTVIFEYSTDPDFPEDETPPPDTIAATPSPVTGTGLNLVTADVTGLTPGTVYHFRVAATNASGTTYGNILQFQTDPPATVTTGIASPVTTTTATLQGTVNANNNSTAVTFEYGTTTSYGSTVTADQSPVTGTVDTFVSKAITGLTPNTAYHFRVVGTNGLGTSNGDDQTFFTSAQAAPTATTEDATFSLTANRATLNGVVNANNADATVTFEYGTTTAYGTTVTADQSPVLGSTDTAVSKPVTGLTPNTTYHFRVVATNSAGTTNGADMTFYNTTEPYARTDAASAITQTTATVRGTVNPKTPDSGPSTWTTAVTFEYGLTASYGSTVTATESPIGGGINQGVSFNLTGLSPNTTYHYRVAASNENGAANGEDMTFTTSSLPVVSTNTAAPVGTTTATLNGTVNANGESTAVTFEYGTTTAYGTTVTADQSPATGTSDTVVSKAIAGLLNGTTYHYRVVATNGSGTVNGADQTFTTGVSPPTASTGAATSVTTTSAVMNGTVNANGLSTNVSFEWGLTAAYGVTNSASPNPVTGSTNTAVTFNPTTLLPNTTYHYRVVAQNAGGTVYGADMSFTTNASPTVTTDAATSVTTTGATLNGTVNANNQSSTVTFEYGLTTAYGTTVTADQSPVAGGVDTAVSKAISSLTPSTTYHYRVVATNASGTSYGADMTFTTTVGPPVVTTGSASPLATGGVLNGTVNAQNASTTVTFEYGLTAAYGQVATADQSPVTGSANTAVTVTLSGLNFNTTYHYRVVGSNVNGTVNGLDMTFHTGTTPTVTTGSATNVLSNSATVNGLGNGNNSNWNVSFEYGTTVAYGSSASGTPALVSGTTDTPISAALTGLTPNTTYHYRAVLTGIGTYYGADMTFTTPSGPTVTTGAASSVGANTAAMNGTVNANNDSTTVTFEYGFDTSYGQTAAADQSPVTGNTGTAVSNTLTGLIPNQAYHYRVVGANVNGTNTGADTTFTTGAVAPAVATNAATGIGATGATLTGTVNPNNDSTTVTFEYGTTTAYGSTVTADQSPLTGTSNTLVSKGITGLLTNTTYHYRVVGQNGTGTTNGTDMTFTTGTNTPTAVTNAASGINTTSGTLNGTVNANGDSTMVTFEYGTTTAYGKTATADQSPVAGTTDTAASVTVGGLIGSTTYHYRLVAQNSYGVTYGADMTFTTPGSAPDATTNAASSVGAASAVLNGTVNANSDSTTVTFEYGTTIAYGNTVTAGQSPVTGSSDTAVSNTLTGLASNTAYHYRVVGQNSFGTTYGTDMTFTTSASASETVTVSITNPAEGEEVSGTVTIEATATSSARNSTTAKAIARAQFYIDDVYQGSDTSAPYEFAWDTTGSSDGTHTIKVIAYNVDNERGEDEISVTVDNSGGGTPGSISLNRTKMNFSAVPNSSSGDSFFDVTYDQSLLVNVEGNDSLSWSVSGDASWLAFSPTSGTGSGVVSVSVDPTGLSAGTYTATLAVQGGTSSATVAVTLMVYNPGATTGPFGTFSTPVSGSTVRSSIPVTGWVLDDIATESVKIYRDPVSGETKTGGNGMIYIGNANFVDGARPDVESQYPDYPLNYRAGWGYMMLTNGLPGDGSYTLYAIAADVEGNEVTLGSKTITVVNADAIKPFGTIDTPDQGGEASGSAFVNFGWALTPQPNTIPADGSTIKVWIDGVPLPGNPVYNQFRQDIANLFPGYNNSNGAVGFMTIDTTAYVNGVHTIAWSVQDDAGNTDGIGSRYFTILNTGGSERANSARGFASLGFLDAHTAIDYMGPVFARKGFNISGSMDELPLDENNTAIMTIKEVEPIHIQLGANISGAKGYLVVDGGLAPLPVGTTFNEATGSFSWQPGPGFVGTYHFVFVFNTGSGPLYKKAVDIRIEPKFNVDK